MEGTGAVDRIEISGEEGLKMEKKGILVVSFGTSHLDTMAKTIQVMEEQIAEAFPGVYGIPGIYKSDDLEQTGTDRT